MTLNDKTIVITRSSQDAATFISSMRQNNAKPIALPTIKLVSKGDEIVAEFIEMIKLVDPDYSIFMSSNAVRILFETAKSVNLYDELVLAVSNTSVVAVGPKTKKILEDNKIRVRLMPNTYSSVGIGEILTSVGAVGKRAIIPRSGASKPFLKQLLQKIGIHVTEMHMYNPQSINDTFEWKEFKSLFASGEIHGIIFTSASSVRAFFDVMSKEYASDTLVEKFTVIKVVAIGPFTKIELEKKCIPCTVAQIHTISGAITTLINMF